MGRREIMMDTMNHTKTMFVLVFCVFLYVLDVFSDVAVAVMHFRDNHTLYFVLTLLMVILSCVVVTIISAVWYLTDREMEETFRSMHLLQPRLNIWRIIPLLLQIAPLIRYVDALRYMVKASKLKEHSSIELGTNEKVTVTDCEEGAKSEIEDTAFLMIIKAGLQSAPQIVLQLAILLHSGYQNPTIVLSSSTATVQMVSIVISLVSLVYAQSSLRSAQQDDSAYSGGEQKSCICFAVVLHILWILLINAARLSALAIFASSYPEWTVLACGVHWVIMYTWLFNMDTSFCFDRLFLEQLLATATSMAYVFFYVDLLDNPSFWRYLSYHLVQFLENMLLVGLWVLWTEPQLWWYYYAPAIHIALYILGIITQLVYYRHFHPKSHLIRLRRRLPRSWKNFGLELTGQSAMFDPSEECPSEPKRTSTLSRTRQSI